MSEEIARVQYVGDGQTQAFAYPFRLFAAQNLKVYVNAEPVWHGWRIDRVDSPGTLTFEYAPEQDDLIILQRELPVMRTGRFQDSGVIKAKALNDELDYLLAVSAQIADQARRSLGYGPGMPLGSAPTLPVPSSGRALIWDDNGLGLINSNADFNTIVQEINTHFAEIAEFGRQAQQLIAVLQNFENTRLALEAQMSGTAEQIGDFEAFLEQSLHDLDTDNFSPAFNDYLEQLETTVSQAADKNFTNAAPNLDFITESWRSNDGNSWYNKYRSGWVEQKVFSPSATSSGQQNFTANLLIPMDNTKIFIAPCYRYGSGESSVIVNAYIHSSGLTVRVAAEGLVAGSRTGYVDVLVMGYPA